VITTPFAPKARREAEVFGMGDLPLVVIPHLGENDVPIGQLHSDGVRRVAERSVDEIRFVLTASRADVASAYHGATAARAYRGATAGRSHHCETAARGPGSSDGAR